MLHLIVYIIEDTDVSLGFQGNKSNEIDSKVLEVKRLMGPIMHQGGNNEPNSLEQQSVVAFVR